MILGARVLGTLFKGSQCVGGKPLQSWLSRAFVESMSEDEDAMMWRLSVRCFFVVLLCCF